MTNIKVDPDNLCKTSKRLKELSRAMGHLANDASSAGNSAPSYEGQFGSRVSPFGSGAISRLNRQAAELENYASQLERKAAAFEQADNSYSGSRSWLDLLRILREGGLKGVFDALNNQRLLEMTGLLGLGALYLPPMPWNPTQAYASDGSATDQNPSGIIVWIGKIGGWFKGICGRIFGGWNKAEIQKQDSQTESSVLPVESAMEATTDKIPDSLLPKSPFKGGYIVTGTFGTYFDDTRLHNGCDYMPQNPLDTDIHPIGPGKVLKVDTECKMQNGKPVLDKYGNKIIIGYGHFVRIEHKLTDGTSILTVYAHMNSLPSLEEGTIVNHDTVLGTMGSSGRSDGPHLHVDIHESGNSSYEYYKHPNPYEIIIVDGKEMTRLEEMKMHWIDPAEVLDPNNAGQYQFVPATEW